MKTEQEQIEEMSCILTMLINCGGGCMAQYCHLVDNYAKKLIEAGYGDVSEYKAEIEDLKDEIIYLERKIAIRDNALKDRDKAIEMLEGKQDTIVKQAKIDVLNELKDGYEDDISTSNDCDMVVRVDDIDKLINEVENE